MHLNVPNTGDPPSPYLSWDAYQKMYNNCFASLNDHFEHILGQCPNLYYLLVLKASLLTMCIFGKHLTHLCTFINKQSLRVTVQHCGLTFWLEQLEQQVSDRFTGISQYKFKTIFLLLDAQKIGCQTLTEMRYLKGVKLIQVKHGLI